MASVVRKNQLQRLCSIIQILQSYPSTKTEIIEKLYLRFDQMFCNSQIEKDLFCLKMDFDAPIEFSKDLKKYVIDKDYDFKNALYEYVCL